MVQDWIGIAFVSCCKHDDIKVFAKFFYYFFGIWTYIYKATADFALKGFEGDFDLISWSHDLTSVNKGLIHIENECFSVYNE